MREHNMDGIAAEDYRLWAVTVERQVDESHVRRVSFLMWSREKEQAAKRAVTAFSYIDHVLVLLQGCIMLTFNDRRPSRIGEVGHTTNREVEVTARQIKESPNLRTLLRDTVKARL